MRKLYLPTFTAILALAGCASDEDSNQGPSKNDVRTEHARQDADDRILVRHGETGVIDLEDPFSKGETGHLDHGDAGSDVIHYHIEEAGKYTLCFEDDDGEAHQVTLAKEGVPIHTLVADTGCQVVELDVGEHELRFRHAGHADDTKDTIFVQPAVKVSGNSKSAPQEQTEPQNRECGDTNPLWQDTGSDYPGSTEGSRSLVLGSDSCRYHDEDDLTQINARGLLKSNAKVTLGGWFKVASTLGEREEQTLIHRKSANSEELILGITTDNQFYLDYYPGLDDTGEKGDNIKYIEEDGKKITRRLGNRDINPWVAEPDKRYQLVANEWHHLLMEIWSDGVVQCINVYLDGGSMHFGDWYKESENRSTPVCLIEDYLIFEYIYWKAVTRSPWGELSNAKTTIGRTPTRSGPKNRLNGEVAEFRFYDGTNVLDGLDMEAIRTKPAVDMPLQDSYQQNPDGYLIGRLTEQGMVYSGNQKSAILLQTQSCSNCDLSGLPLEKADLSNANLHGADLTDIQAQNSNLQNANLGACDLTNAVLNNAVLTEANLSYAYLEKTNLQSADLSNIKAPHLQVYSVDSLTGAKLSDANLANAVLVNVDFSSGDGDIKNMILDGAQLYNTNFDGMDLTGASLTGAHLQGTSFESAQMYDVDMTNAKIHQDACQEDSSSSYTVDVVNWQKNKKKTHTLNCKAFAHQNVATDSTTTCPSMDTGPCDDSAEWEAKEPPADPKPVDVDSW